MDTVAHGLIAGLAGTDTQVRILPVDLRDVNFAAQQYAAVVSASEAKVDGICVFTLDETEPESAVWRSIGAGVPVVALHKPSYPVTASICVPNFYHGLYLTQYLARQLGDRPRVAIVGGPPILDDEELVTGLLEGARRCGFQLQNDPHAPECRNVADVKGGGASAGRYVLDTCSDLDALVVFNDETVLDVLPLLEERGLLGELPVVSRNGSPAAVAAVARGELLATYDYDLPELGLAAGRVFAALFDGQLALEDQVVCPGAGRLIDREAAAGYRPWSERAPEVELVVGLD
jgi:ribose transport system substrate-binding protein